MKKEKHIGAVIALMGIVFLILLTSCSPEKKKYTAYSLDYFDTATTITGYEKSQEDFDLISGEILGLLGEYHRLYTIYHRFEGTENLCTVNELRDGTHRTVTVDKRIIDMLTYAKEMYSLLQLQGAPALNNFWVGVGDLYVTVYGGRTRLVGILLGRGMNIDEAKAELNGVTLESLVVAVRVARAMRIRAERGEADLSKLPLLMHVDEILTEKAAVNIPWESFTFVQA